MDKIIDNTLPVAAIIPTANRPEVLQRTLESIRQQNVHLFEIIIIDASADDASEKVCNKMAGNIKYIKAIVKGAATQRNQGVEKSRQPYILFMDDDIILEPGCIENLWNCLLLDSEAGGANALITNQRYHRPGKITGIMYRLMNGKKLECYAGKCIGPAWNLLPEDCLKPRVYNQVEWLNLGCVLYRKEVLPDPVFSKQFTGYSMMEDLALSLKIAKTRKLYNVPDAKIFHDSQQGTHKNSVYSWHKMELINRHYIMTKVLGRTNFSYYFRLCIFELWVIGSALNTGIGWKTLLFKIFGKFAAIGNILFTKRQHEQ